MHVIGIIQKRDFIWQVYGLFAHESTLVWDGKTGNLIQKLTHEGGLQFKIALSCDFVALALEGRDKVKAGLHVLSNINLR
jgi:hypothetical protein